MPGGGWSRTFGGPVVAAALLLWSGAQELRRTKSVTGIDGISRPRGKTTWKNSSTSGNFRLNFSRCWRHTTRLCGTTWPRPILAASFSFELARAPSFGCTAVIWDGAG